MAGSAAHGQHNKPHKRGRKAGASARTKHQLVKEGGRPALKSGQNAVTAGRLQRQNEAKQARERKRSQSLAERRREGPPTVVALLPLSAEVDVGRLWRLLLGAFDRPPGSQAVSQKTKKDGPEQMEEDGEKEQQYPLVPTTVAMPGRPKLRYTLLPPPRDRADPLAAVDLAKAAELVVALLPGQAKAVCMDRAGQQVLAVLRQMGIPALLGLVTGTEHRGGNAAALLKEKAAARKRAAAVLQSEVPGEHKVVAVDDEADAAQLLRTLAEAHAVVPQWRRQRPCLLADAAHFFPGPSGADVGTLTVRGYVRNMGLSANQLVTVPGAGDFQIARIEGAREPHALGAPARVQRKAPDQAMEVETTGTGPVVLPDPARQEPLVRENVPDPLAGEQTWPTEQEMEEADAAGRKRRRLPRGTSDYQAAWILDDDEDGADDLLGVSEGEEEEGLAGAGDRDAADDETASVLGSGGLGSRTVAGETEFGEDEGAEDMEDDEEAAAADMKKRWREQQDDVMFPDEMDTPRDIAARVRFAKYRGLRSWRSSPWDPKENLPQEYGRVFAFENPKRAHKRARAAAEAAGGPGDFNGVPAGSYVVVHVANVPTAAAAAVVARVAASLQKLMFHYAAKQGEAAPLAVFGLLQHESRLSVLNFSLRKAAAFEAPLPNKAPLFFVTGLRSFSARPIFSADESQGDRFKMERFLHPGRQAMATVYAPIAFGPLPLLAFHREADGALRLAASGTLRSCDTDRMVLKKVVLSGYPVKVHKHKAVVRWMFFSPDDVRWFRPLELWTKHGRRGRIKESVGTHGTMKCMFDGPVLQQDSVCVSLYKRTFPVWPADMVFA